MIGLIAILIVILLAVIVVQIGRVSELAAKIRGEQEVYLQKNNRTGVYLVIFMVGFLIFCVVSAYIYKDRMLGYGPHEAASAHGIDLDSLFNLTLFFTGIVFVLTHIALFWFSYKYREEPGRKAYFFVHSTKLEVFWTVIPTIVLFFLVVRGLNVWNNTMSDISPGEEHIEIEATGYQFAWDIRYPGPDGKLGTRDYMKIDPGSNPLGQDWTDIKNIDDFHPDKIVLPVNKKVRVRITAKDVLHNFYLPHFRVKMDAVPGLPTYFIFTPTKTTAEYREGLKDYPEYQQLSDPTDPESKLRWEDFQFELACAELCGKGHYSMRRIVEIVEQDEYEKWLSEQNSYYMSNIRNTDDDPFRGQLLDVEILSRDKELETEFSSELTDEGDGIINLKNVFFESGSAILKDISQHELKTLSSLMKKTPNLKVELGGHTDSQGDAANNMSLSEARATSVLNFLGARGVPISSMTSKGYGETNPVADNETAEGRQQNRRTELKILAK